MKIEKVENTRTIKRKAKNLIINPNNEELSDNKNNKPRKTTIIERIYSDKRKYCMSEYEMAYAYRYLQCSRQRGT